MISDLKRNKTEISCLRDGQAGKFQIRNIQISRLWDGKQLTGVHVLGQLRQNFFNHPAGVHNITGNGSMKAAKI